MTSLENASQADLINAFRDLCVKQYDTYIYGTSGKYNRFQDSLLLITRELKRRGIEERRMLLGLLNDNNPQVQFQAASSVYSVAPAEAKACLENIRSKKWPDVSLAAGMTLRGLEEDPHCLDWI